MLDPQAVLSQANQGRAPATWRIVAKEKGRLRGTSGDPDPLLVITPDGVVEYIDSKKSRVEVDFASLHGLLRRPVFIEAYGSLGRGGLNTS